MHRKDRKKGGGGLIIYFASTLPSRKLALPTQYKMLEAIAVASKIGRNNILFVSIYRPPRQTTRSKNKSYLWKDQEEMNDICKWACFQRQTVVILGDLNMNTLRANSGEGKILSDLGELNNLHCIVNEPTRITAHSKSLLDVILHEYSWFVPKCGTHEPEISDISTIWRRQDRERSNCSGWD